MLKKYKEKNNKKRWGKKVYNSQPSGGGK